MLTKLTARFRERTVCAMKTYSSVTRSTPKFNHFLLVKNITVEPAACKTDTSLQWRHNGLDGVSNHQPHHCLLSHLFGRRSKKSSKFRVTGLCAGNSPGTSEFPAQMSSNAENVLFDDVIMFWEPCCNSFYLRWHIFVNICCRYFKQPLHLPPDGGVKFQVPGIRYSDLLRTGEPWWRHNMETLSALLVFYEGNPRGNPLVNGGFNKGTAMRSFHVYSLKKTVELPFIWDAIILIWRHCNGLVTPLSKIMVRWTNFLHLLCNTFWKR